MTGYVKAPRGRLLHRPTLLCPLLVTDQLCAMQAAGLVWLDLRVPSRPCSGRKDRPGGPALSSFPGAAAGRNKCSCVIHVLEKCVQFAFFKVCLKRGTPAPLRGDVSHADCALLSC